MRLGPGSTLFLSLGSSVVVSNFHLHLRLSRSSIAQCSSLFGWHGHGELLTTLQLATLQCLRWSRRLIPTQHPFGFKFNSAGLSRPHNTHRARPDRPFGYVSPARSNEISSARRVNRHQARLRQIKLAPTIRRFDASNNPRVLFTRSSSLPADLSACQHAHLPGPGGDQARPFSLSAS